MTGGKIVLKSEGGKDKEREGRWRCGRDLQFWNLGRMVGGGREGEGRGWPAAKNARFRSVVRPSVRRPECAGGQRGRAREYLVRLSFYMRGTFATNAVKV